MKSIDEIGERLEGLTDDLRSKETALSILRELKLWRLVNEDYLRKIYLKNKDFFDELESLPASNRAIHRIVAGNKVLKDLDKIEHDAFEILDRYKTTNDDDGIYVVAAKLVCCYIEYQLSDIGLGPKK